MGVSVVRLRAVGEAKDVIVQLPPPPFKPPANVPKYLCRQMWLGGCPAEGTRYTSWSGHPDHDFPAPTAPSTGRPCSPLIAHPSAVGHLLKGLTGLWNRWERSPPRWAAQTSSSGPWGPCPRRGNSLFACQGNNVTAWCIWMAQRHRYPSRPLEVSRYRICSTVGT